MADGEARAAEEPGRPAVLPATEELIARIGWLIRLRWVAVAGILILVEVGRRILPLQFHLAPVYAVAAILAVFNLSVSLVFPRVRARGVQRARAAAERGASEQAGKVARFLLPPLPTGLVHGREAGEAALFANLQITVDLIVLAAFLHYAGGIENPVQVFFLFHVIIASMLLSRRATYLHASLGLALLTAVAAGEYWGLLPHYPLYSQGHADVYRDAPIVGTQLFLLGVTLYVTAYLGTAIAVRLRRRELEVVVLSRQLAEKADRLQTAFTEVSAAEKAKSQYMRKVAHELRGPLGTIKTALSVVLRSPADVVTEAARELIEMARGRAGELAVMTAELLMLARARGSKTAVEHGPVDLAAVAGHVLEKLRLRAEERGVVVAREIGGDVREMQGDAEGLGDMMSNLVENAIRYTPTGGTVTFRLHGGRTGLVIDVQDTGIGIPEADLPRIFEEFFRSKEAREFAPDGTGLGMAIVKAVVDQHGGTISVRSTPGQGTCVRVELPLSGAA
jgi:signal transduction histidine kinase